ncbi:MAG: cytochrome c-type biogenesis protein CcmH [Lysobacter sp.]|nr:cytochrome c-type biogenesis protein CcmH [Lysobacter sp.]
MSIDVAVKGKSPLPPFCKGGNSTWSPIVPGGVPNADSGIEVAAKPDDTSPPLSSPFAKGGLRGICVSLVLGLLIALLASTAAFAQKATDPAPLQFNSAVEEKRFHALVAELRCVMCQNQSLADSNAQIAVDLRREVLQLIREGRSDQEVRDFLVARYGEFVLYRPQVGAKTWLLWFGPLLFALLGGVVVWRLLRRNAGAAPPPADDSQEW